MKYLKMGALVVLSTALVACSDDNKQQGYVEGRYTYASSYTAGYLDHLQVRRGERVVEGQPLFVLNLQPEADELAQAKANQSAEKETLTDMQLGERPSKIEALTEEIKAAAASVTYSKKMLQRNSALYKARAIGLATLDDYRTTYLKDLDTLKELQADLVTAKLGARVNQQNAQADKLKAAQAQTSKANWILSTKEFKAPKSGRVDETFYRQGEFIPAGQPVLSMLVPSEVKIIFYIPEPQLGAIQLGNTIHFNCDGCKASTAKIDYIASKAEYTPPVLYTQDARTNLVYRVEAAIPKMVALSYHPGQPVDITLPKKARAAK